MTPASAHLSPISPSPRGAALAITVAPRASRTAIEQLPDGTLRVRLAAPPVDGAANAALLRYLADALDIPRSRLSIASGAASRRKRIDVADIASEALATKLEAALTRRL